MDRTGRAMFVGRAGVAAIVSTVVGTVLLCQLPGGVAGASAPTPVPPTTIVPPPTPTTEVSDGPPPLIEVPVGCPNVEVADVAFVGTVVAKDYRTVRFEIDQVRARSTSPWAIDGLIDVRFGSDTQFLDVGHQYLVGAAVDPALGVLASTVRPPEPLFGGNDVVGVDDSAVECRNIDSGIRTLEVDGTSVDSGVLSPLLADKQTLLATVGVPAAIILAALLGLVVLRVVWKLAMRGVFELGRAAVTPTVDHRAVRVRSHRGAGRWRMLRRSVGTE